MLTLHRAAELLAAARSVAGLAAMAQAIRLSGPAEQLDDESQRALGLPPSDMRLAGGAGQVRAIFASVAGSSNLRTEMQRIAGTLASRAPHVQWLLFAVDESGTSAGISAWSATASGRRTASFVWEPGRVLPSDAETLCALGVSAAADGALLHARCMEVLGREALGRRFYRALQAHVQLLADSLPGTVVRDDARSLALLYASRLLFLCFLEAKGWLDGDRGFIGNRFDECMRSGGAFHRRVLLPLFFGTLNTPVSRRAAAARSLGHLPFLNGGLFARTPLERRLGRVVFTDERVGALLHDVFQRFRFVAREDSQAWTEAAVDPEMLGRAFESLMAPAERRDGGSYYTPQPLVVTVAEGALAALDPSALQTIHGARALRILDPACGSGAFLVYLLERLADLRSLLGEQADVASIRRDVLTHSIFGVDRDPTAVWLCELRLWLSVVIESGETDPLRVRPLPNLDRNIRVGDALTGSAFAGGMPMPGSRKLTVLRQRYARATGARKNTLSRELDRDERRRAIGQLDREMAAARHARGEHLSSLRARDLFGERVPPGADARATTRRLRDALRSLRTQRRRIADGGALPFSFPACFADVHASGGFDVVVGNPPWVRLHRIPLALRQQFRRTYEVFRTAAWQAGATGARAATGFASQVDLAALFTERALALLRPRGVVSLLLPVKLWHALSAGGLRQLVQRETNLMRLEDFSASRHAFDAAVYPSLLVARRSDASTVPGVAEIAVHGVSGPHRWRAEADSVALDSSPGAPWLLIPPDARAAFDRLREAGVPLSESVFGPPRLGVKSGCNAAFLLRVVDSTRDVAVVAGSDGEEGKVELSLLRPALRGDAVTPWARRACEEWILWTHDARGPLAQLPERARAWLRRHHGDLVARADAARSRRWWALFRTDAADSSRPRVVWADFGKRPRAMVLPAHDPVVPMNTCYVVHCADACDAYALAALLNSRVAAAWLNAIAEPARGGYRRYLGWTVGRMPVPRDWGGVRVELAAAARQAADIWPEDPTAADDLLTRSVCAAYDAELRELAPLLETP